MSKIVSLSDLQQLVHRMEAPLPRPPRCPRGPTKTWLETAAMSQSALVRAAFGLVTSSMTLLYSRKVRVVLYRRCRTSRRVVARKTITTHKGPLKQLVRELAFLSSLRYTNIVRFYSAYTSPSNSEVKLVVELCEGRSLAAIGEQIKRTVREKSHG